MADDSADDLDMSAENETRPLSFVQIAEGIDGSEGPLTTVNGELFVVEPPRGGILRISQTGEKIPHANTGGIPAGLQLHRDGSIWIADMKKGILRLDPNGDLTAVVATFEGQPMRGCNDCVFDSQGNLYFTAPAGSSRDNPCGELFCHLTDGAVRKLDGGFAFSNGIAISADDRTLIVAETFTKQLHAYTVEAPGVVSEKRLFATLPGDHHGGPDGMDYDSEGRLLVANWGGQHLDVFTPTGQLDQRVRLPFAKPSNLHFGGPQSTALFVTEHSTAGVWRGEWSCPGQLQFGWR